MARSITGRIYEKESGRALVGLNVRAYDKDLFMDDLLGAAVTDKEGKFRIEYSKQDFSELFEQNPDIYLSIFSSSFHPIIDTKEQIRWGAAEKEHFDIAIPRRGLRGETYTLASNRVDAGRGQRELRNKE